MPRSNDSISTSASSGSFTRFEYQVAGHDRLLQHPASDIMVVKPCNQTEQRFYQDSQQHPEFLQWIPECYGSLHIATEIERQTIAEAQDIADGVKSISLNEPTESFNPAELDDHICIENLLYGFTQPCVMDIKLGTQLYGPDATPSKRAKMIKKANETTSGKLGIKICGMQMFDASTNQHIVHSKTYIKQITESSLLNAFMSFFFPHSEVGHAIVEGRERLHLPLEGSRIPAAKMRWIIRSLIEDIEEILETVANCPNVRMYGASLLIVYEGDQSAFLNGWEKMLEEDRLQEERASQQAKDNQAADDDSENEEDEDEQPAKLYSIRLIDFAHSFWEGDEVTEQDAGLLLGLTNASNILRSVLATQKEGNV
ncbi:hypothetical protein K450DRAFT_257767 [Umbelopsis ramanniana AG]|uniref:Kinase n=1 Tax=Umbelopsis ramanniana AG TaxID=1314678 RepID=A0AAD5E3U6_UMBRA|nr:uncharacterized protein K450DRAFT_257767 [Umbelopsis ramanniana AG]KAI8576234.1 hypothetical protein K450DRAFT_257767 [Umbelopsis ramanniana AG]